jgi:hypothetical protein
VRFTEGARAWLMEWPRKPRRDVSAFYTFTAPERRARAQLHRAEKLQRVPAWLTEADHARMSEVFEDAELFSNAFGVKFHVDHDLPLKGRTVTGLHAPSNLRIVPAAHNLAKGNRTDYSPPPPVFKRVTLMDAGSACDDYYPT